MREVSAMRAEITTLKDVFLEHEKEEEATAKAVMGAMSQMCDGVVQGIKEFLLL